MNVMTALQIVLAQIERDNRINRLICTVATLYELVLASHPMAIIKSYERTIERLLRQTKECAYFILEYWKMPAGNPLIAPSCELLGIHLSFSSTPCCALPCV
jgi:hypothetical protein